MKKYRVLLFAFIFLLIFTTVAFSFVGGVRKNGDNQEVDIENTGHVEEKTPEPQPTKRNVINPVKIKDSQDPTAVTPTPREKKKETNSVIWLVGILTMLALGGGGAYYYYRQSTNF